MVWFGLYICPDKPKPIYGDGWAKEKGTQIGEADIQAWVRSVHPFEMLTLFLFFDPPTELSHRLGACNYSAKEPICRNGSPLSDESKDGIKRGLSVFPCRVGNGMESVEGIGAGIGTEAT